MLFKGTVFLRTILADWMEEDLVDLPFFHQKAQEFRLESQKLTETLRDEACSGLVASFTQDLRRLSSSSPGIMV